MANVVTQRTLFGGASSKNIIRHINVASDGTEEANLIVYNNSDFVADASKGKVLRMTVAGNYTGSIVLAFDQNTDSPIISLGEGSCGDYDFRSFGGISNPGAAGATGDILLTTRALAALDDFTLILEIEQN